MSQCVPSWDIHESPTPPRLTPRSPSNSNLLNYEVAELTWENGQIAMHSLGPPRVSNKPPFTASSPTKYAWEKPRAAGTLESIVNQATFLPHYKPAADGGDGDELVPWFEHPRANAAAPATVTMDALVPCSSTLGAQEASGKMLEGIGTCVVRSSTRVGSCSGGDTFENNGDDDDEALTRGKDQTTRTTTAAAQEWSSRNNSGSGSATLGRDSLQLTLDTSDGKLGVCGFTSTSVEYSLENTSSGKPCTIATTTTDDHDSVCHSRPQREVGDEKNKKKPAGKSSTSTRRSRAAAIHNQSERKRRDKINQRMKTLQKLVPNSNKTDKASMLDEVIEYVKQLQAQLHMMSRMNMPSSSSSMILPVTLQQQLQLSMMAPMGMGLSMGMGMGMGMSCMDINSVGHPNIAGIHPALLHPAAAFMPLASWDAAAGDRFSAPPAAVFPDPISTLLACQSQPMTMDAYSRMAALYQQLHQSPPFRF
ncbi:hypothetical protein U1Q18_023343 [Sarracenia purpurea var. burkii]